MTMQQPDKSWAGAMRSHFRKRAKQRFKLDLDKGEQASIVAEIQSGRAPLVGKAKRGRKIYVISRYNQIIRVVYDPKRKALATPLPPKPEDLCLKLNTNFK